MKEYNHLSRNLRSYKAAKNLTTKQLSSELDIPEATLRNVMKDGNTTLDTVIRISKGLDISLDMLINDADLPDKLIVLKQIQRAGSWLAELPPEKSDKIAALIAEIWEVMSE